MKHRILVALILASTPPISEAAEVILDYRAEAQTVVGTPFGLIVPRLTIVTGHFLYETDDATDANPSPERGWYQLVKDGAFSATFSDGSGTSHTLTGSTTPWLEVEDILVNNGTSTIDTFRFWDGNDTDTKGGLMRFDGVEDGDYFLTFAMTDGDGDAFPNDSLPACYPMTGVEGPPESPFPTYPFPHTFVIGDGSGFEGTGQMLLQLNWLSQRDTTPVITSAAFAAGFFAITFTSREDCTYTVEFSTDLSSWDPVASDIPATGASTTFSDTGVVTRLGSLPETAYYRVRRE